MGRNKQVTDEAVLKAARDVFVEKGYGASTREIAARAGVSEAVLYQRYKTKIALFFAAMVPPPFDLITERRKEARGNLAGEIGAIALEILAYFRNAMPVLLQLVNHPSFSLSELTEREARLPLHELGKSVADCLEHFGEMGAITADRSRIDAATMTLLATLHSLVLFERMGVHGGSIPDRMIEDIAGLIAAGLSPLNKGEPRRT